MRIRIPDGDGLERPRMWQLNPALGEAAEGLRAAVENQSGLPIRLQELIRYRIALVNNCPV
jgi:hypothetical protein